jgi:hypothetical protein
VVPSWLSEKQDHTPSAHNMSFNDDSLSQGARRFTLRSISWTSIDFDVKFGAGRYSITINPFTNCGDPVTLIITFEYLINWLRNIVYNMNDSLFSVFNHR